MPIPLNALREKRICLEIPEFPGLTVWHRVNAYTPAFEAEVQEALAGGATAQFLPGFLPPLIAEWDLIDDAGEFGEAGAPVPLTPEALATLPTELLVAVSAAIGKAHRPFAETASDAPTGNS